MLIARGREKLEALASELAIPDRVAIEALDVTDTEGFQAVLDRAHKRFGSIDVLVNNAGFHQRGPVESVDAEALGRMIDVNLKAPIMADPAGPAIPAKIPTNPRSSTLPRWPEEPRWPAQPPIQPASSA